jgi:hypothetical protein
MNIHEVPALMTVDTAARFLRISRLAAEDAVESGELPVVIIDGEAAIDGRRLLAELGVDLTALEQEESEAPA